MIVVILTAVVIMGLLGVMLAKANHARNASYRDRNWELALSVAESGVHEGVAKVHASGGTYEGSFEGETAQGRYNVVVQRQGEGYVVQSVGLSAVRPAGAEETLADYDDALLSKRRMIRVTLAPPRSFPCALFSATTLEIKNGSVIDGKVCANESITVGQNAEVSDGLQAARGWISVGNGAMIGGDVWSGGFTEASGGYAVDLGTNSRVEGTVRASVSAPADPITCGGEPSDKYKVLLAGGSVVVGDVYTWGTSTGAGTVQGQVHSNQCTSAAVPRPLPEFNFNASNYDQSSYHEFPSVADFQDWLTDRNRRIAGTFYVSESSPSQTNRIDLSGVTVTGDTTIVTNAPVFTNGVGDEAGPQRTFTLVSSYRPPTNSACSVNQDSSECAIHIKNNFQPSCTTAVLIYADNGPVAVKNDMDACGSIYGQSVLIKNNQNVTWTERIERTVGFGTVTYEPVRWEERVPQ